MKIHTLIRACIYFKNKWPSQLTSGIMFFEGERITKEEFEEQAELM